jgi:hypothetical protein
MAQSFPAYGIHRRRGIDVTALADDLGNQGWRVFVLGPTKDKATFIADAAARLPLAPAVRTANWDAFADSLGGGLMKLEDDAIAIVMEHADGLLQGDPPAFSTALSILSDTVYTLADPDMTGGRPTKRLLVLLDMGKPISATWRGRSTGSDV